MAVTPVDPGPAVPLSPLETTSFELTEANWAMRIWGAAHYLHQQCQELEQLRKEGCHMPRPGQVALLERSIIDQRARLTHYYTMWTAYVATHPDAL